MLTGSKLSYSEAFSNHSGGLLYEAETCCMKFQGAFISYRILVFHTNVGNGIPSGRFFFYLCLPMPKYITISTKTELLRVPSERLMYVTSDGNYSYIYTQDGLSRLVSLQLGQIEDLILKQLGEEETPFVRLGKSLIVNRDFVFFIDISRQKIIVSDWKGNNTTLSASRQALVSFKSVLESECL